MIDPTTKLDPVLERTFAALQAHDIAYVVLRGYLPLQSLSAPGDIDIFVAGDDRDRAFRVLHDEGWLYRRLHFGRYPHHFLDHLASPDTACLVLDVVDHLVFGEQLRFLTGEDHVLASRVAHGPIQVPSPWFAALLLTLHVLLDKRFLSPANTTRLRSLMTWCKEVPEDSARIADLFGPDALALVDALMNSLGLPIDDGHLALLVTSAEGLKCLRPHPVRAQVDRARLRLRRELSRPVRIAIVGPDGAGKSTLVSRTVEELGAMSIGSAYLGNNDFQTRTMRWILAHIYRLEGDGRDRTLAYKVLAKLWTLWWPIELRVRMRRAEFGRAITLYDRFPFPGFDAVDGPRSIWSRIADTYQRFATSRLPQPDILVLLDGTPRVLWERKQEYSFELFLAVRDRLRSLYDDFPGSRELIQTDRGVDHSFESLRDLLARSPVVRRRVYAEARDSK